MCCVDAHLTSDLSVNLVVYTMRDSSSWYAELRDADDVMCMLIIRIKILGKQKRMKLWQNVMEEDLVRQMVDEVPRIKTLEFSAGYVKTQ